MLDLDRYGVEVAPLRKYRWGNNERRAQLKGRFCVVLAEGRMNSVLVQFIDTGEKIVTSRHALA